MIKVFKTIMAIAIASVLIAPSSASVWSSYKTIMIVRGGNYTTRVFGHVVPNNSNEAIILNAVMAGFMLLLIIVILLFLALVIMAIWRRKKMRKKLRSDYLRQLEAQRVKRRDLEEKLRELNEKDRETIPAMACLIKKCLIHMKAMHSGETTEETLKFMDELESMVEEIEDDANRSVEENHQGINN